MKKQTAVEWLLEELKKVHHPTEAMIMYAKKLEKQQIIDAFDEGQEYEYQYHINNTPKFDSQTYFDETYGSKGSETKQSLYTKEQLREAFRGFASGKSFEQYYNEAYGSDETKQ